MQLIFFGGEAFSIVQFMQLLHRNQACGKCQIVFKSFVCDFIVCIFNVVQLARSWSAIESSRLRVQAGNQIFVYKIF